MKYCSHCGNQLLDEAVMCPKCGCMVEQTKGVKYAANHGSESNSSTLKTVAKVFMIISTVIMGLYIIPLAWCLPMTLSYSRKIRDGEPVSTGFKVCCLLFVNIVAGILMLCDHDDGYIETTSSMTQKKYADDIEDAPFSDERFVK